MPYNDEDDTREEYNKRRVKIISAMKKCQKNVIQHYDTLKDNLTDVNILGNADQEQGSYDDYFKELGTNADDFINYVTQNLSKFYVSDLETLEGTCKDTFTGASNALINLLKQVNKADGYSRYNKDKKKNGTKKRDSRKSFDWNLEAPDDIDNIYKKLQENVRKMNSQETSQPTDDPKTETSESDENPKTLNNMEESESDETPKTRRSIPPIWTYHRPPPKSGETPQKTPSIPRKRRPRRPRRPREGSNKVQEIGTFEDLQQCVKKLEEFDTAFVSNRDEKGGAYDQFYQNPGIMETNNSNEKVYQDGFERRCRRSLETLQK